ncbi:hypothetical protein LXA43DRAFT_166417 [Ganoderma leucocontextum]|nr:hypothetical protein LXA43DRAFT_166417 [Ganoderma leucocontextum]
MARGHKKHGRGGFRGPFNDNPRATGRGGGRGRGGRGYTGGRGRGGPAYMDVDDFVIQQWPSNDPPATPPPRGYGRGNWTPRGYGTPRGNGEYRGNGTPRGRGRGRGSSPLPYSTYHNSRRGLGSPQESGRGRGDRSDNLLPYGRGRNLSAKLRAGAPLARLFYEDRPLLKPIQFVRSVYTATLFEKGEDIFLPVVEPAVDGNEQSHAPTANAVLRVFNQTEQAELSGEEDDQLEEIDFADIGKLQAAVDAATSKVNSTAPKVATATESASFFVDTTPAPVGTSWSANRIQVNALDGALGVAPDDDDEEIIVYVAPHPRTGKSTLQDVPPPNAPLPTTSVEDVQVGSQASSVNPPSTSNREVPTVGTSSSQVKHESQKPFSLEMGSLYPEPPSPPKQLGPSPPDAAQLPPPPPFDSVSFSFDKATPATKKPARRLHPVNTPRALLKRSRQPRRRSLRGFGSFGAAHEEAMLREVDPRRDEQRRGDSDVDWGTSDDDVDAVDALSADMGGMELDESIDLAAMKRFVHSMSAEGSRHVTMDDVADVARMKDEDEDEGTRGPESASEDDEDEEGGENAGDMHASRESAGEEGPEPEESEDDDEETEAVMNAEEKLLIAEAGDDVEGEDEDEDEDDEEEDEEEADDSEDEVTPRRNFQARLERLRARTRKGKGKGKATEDSSDEAMSIQVTWEDGEEGWLDNIDDILAENELILGTGNRKARKYMFKAIQNGDFDDKLFNTTQPAKRRKDKGDDVPPEFHEQWEKDRQKKAENKQKRALERMMLAADPLAAHKGGKKGRKAMLAAARAAEDIPNRIVDLVTLEQQIRRFLADIGGSNTMTLPPCDKGSRKRIHELADAFNLKSQSKGKGDERYTTLIKTSKSGVGIKEGKIRTIMKKATNGTWDAPRYGNGGGRANLAKHREGEEVGKDAAKIDGSNIGFKMLAAMGWSDGDRIGLSGGLNAPLTAIMKKTKLGLGATM